MAFDINPFSFIGDLYKTGKLEKWYKFGASCSIAAFVGFWGTMGIVGGAYLSAGYDSTIALAFGFFSGCTVMAGGVLRSVVKSGMWKDLSIVLPPEFTKVIEGVDIDDSRKNK